MEHYTLHILKQLEDESKTDFYSPLEVHNASQALGMSFWGLSEKRKAILTTIYHYKEGWIDEDKLEEKLTKIIKLR